MEENDGSNVRWKEETEGGDYENDLKGRELKQPIRINITGEQGELAKRRKRVKMTRPKISQLGDALY
jgi:hypothetical protein